MTERRQADAALIPRPDRAARIALPDSSLHEGPRRELRRGASGSDLRIAGLAVRAGAVPLFRRSEAGGLLQCLRLAIHSPGTTGPWRFSASAGGGVVDSVAVADPLPGQLVRLFVPEVAEPDTILLRVEGPDGLAEQAVEIRPQRKWEVFLVHHSHLDIGYTDPQALVLSHHLRYLDAALDLVRTTDDWPDDVRFRWNVEANWPLRRWLETRPERVRAALLERAREGRIEICALPFSMHTEAYSHDELARQLVFADEVRERYGVPVDTAMQTDVPGATVGLLSLLVDAGVRYLSVAHNYAGRSVPYLHGGQELGRPFYWRSEGGGRLLVWHTDSPHGVAYMEGNLLGLAESCESALDLLPEYLAALAARPYPYAPGHQWLGLPADFEPAREPYPYDLLHLRVQGVIADNAAPSIVPAAIAREWNERWAYPVLRAATNRDFFAAVEERLGEEFETYTGDWTDWWADGIASGARPLGLNRRAQGGVRTAQTLHALADVLGDGEEAPAWGEEVERAYERMALFDEHTWGAANPWEDALEKMDSGALQWQTKASFAHDAHDGVEGLLESAASRLAQRFAGQGDARAWLVVFNPTSTARTDLVRAFLPTGSVPLDEPFSVVDLLTEEPVPHAVEAQEHAFFRPRGSHLTLVARDVPSYGYRRYVIVAGGTGPAGRDADRVDALENEHYRVEVDPVGGLVMSVVDKEASRELVNAESAFGFNQYVYDRYTSASGFNHLSSRITGAGRWLLGRRSTAGYGVVTRRTSTPVAERLTIRLNAEGAEWLETSFQLARGVKRLDIANRVSKVATPEKESVYFAFPFALQEPAVSFEVTGGVTGTDSPRVPGSAAHMRAVRHWVALRDEATTLAWGTLEAPLVEIGNIFLPYAPFPETVDSVHAGAATIFSWAMNNIWDTNFPPQQGGETTFTYALSSSGGDENERELGMRVGHALAQPLVGIVCPAGAARDLSPSGSFCALDTPGVEVVTIGPSRRGHDLVLFLHSTARETLEVGVEFPDLPVARAWAGTFLERELREAGGNGRASLSIAPGQYVALAVELENGAAG